MPNICRSCSKPVANYANECLECAKERVSKNSTKIQLEGMTIEDLKNAYNKPEHYHKHEIDTIEFLKRGFPPQVFMGFAIGHIIKYAQRAEYKNGREDFVKMVDYAKRALDWYDETHEKELGK